MTSTVCYHHIKLWKWNRPTNRLKITSFERALGLIRTILFIGSKQAEMIAKIDFIISTSCLRESTNVFGRVTSFHTSLERAFEGWLHSYGDILQQQWECHHIGTVDVWYVGAVSSRFTYITSHKQPVPLTLTPKLINLWKVTTRTLLGGWLMKFPMKAMPSVPLLCPLVCAPTFSHPRPSYTLPSPPTRKL